MTEQEAQLAVEAAKAALAHALDGLRQARGEDGLEPCPYCEGSGKDPLEELSGKDAPCSNCDGRERVKATYPWIVTGIDWRKDEVLRPSLRSATWVSVRPCDPSLNGRTYLGWLLGDMALSQAARLKPDGRLEVMLSGHNPAIFVPDLGRVVFGCGSWWAAIKTPEDLRRITDRDISNVWYVMALKELTNDPTKRPADEPPQDTSQLDATLIQQLLDVGSGKLRHDNTGGCPDEVEGFDARDPECPACRAMLMGAKALGSLAQEERAGQRAA